MLLVIASLCNRMLNDWQVIAFLPLSRRNKGLSAALAGLEFAGFKPVLKPMRGGWKQAAPA
jgi:hypothetical protein